MISVILYGRNDSYGYNLHKRAAISLNCMAEVLTHPGDEIIFVDCNTPDDMPTFPEAIQDTLTRRVKSLLFILRVRPGLYDKYKKDSPLMVLEPLSRNVAIRRSNPSNRWILSTNTDMVFVVRHPSKSLSDVVSEMPGGFYELPRFEVPEGLCLPAPIDGFEEATIAQLKAQREALVQRLAGAVGSGPRPREHAAPAIPAVS